MTVERSATAKLHPTPMPVTDLPRPEVRAKRAPKDEPAIMQSFLMQAAFDHTGRL